MLSQHVLQVVSQHALQQVSRWCLVQRACSWGVPGWGVPAPQGVAFCYGLLVGGLLVGGLLVWWPSGVICCYGLLVLGGLSYRDPFQPEGHSRRPYQNGLPSPPRRWLLLQTVCILLESILVSNSFELPKKNHLVCS